MHAWSSGAYVLLAGFSGCPFFSLLSPASKNGATSEIDGGFSAMNGMGRHTAIADRPMRGEQAVEHALAEPRGNARGHAMADDLLQQRIADRHGAGQRQMRGHRPRQPEGAEHARRPP